ncbi:MAG: hypothetical protein RL033_1261, partial [Pseudomonadota bacterium]
LVWHKGELPFVVGQEGRLAQVFLNLIMNAAQAIPPGASEANCISITARSDGQLVTVEIADTGGGIPKEDTERVFDAFFTTKPAGQGTGIGLSFCRDILAQVGGSIRVISSNEHGTTIGVSLRVAASS